jgi:tetratricopeptide (TPR) repeat protein
MKRLGGTILISMGLAAGAAEAQDVAQGIALYNEGRYAEAEPVLRAAAEATEARAYLAATLVRLGRYADAEAQAKATLEAEPAQPVAVRALGEALVKQEKLDEAIARMSAALGAKNDLAYAYYWRGQAYQRNKQIARMVEDYQAFLRLEPKAPEAPAVKVLLGGLQ